MEVGLTHRRGARGVFHMDTSEGSRFPEAVSRSLNSMSGIRTVVVNHVTDKVYVSYDPIRTSPARIRRLIADVVARDEGQSAAINATKFMKRPQERRVPK